MLYDISQRAKRNSLNPGIWKGFTNRDVFGDYFEESNTEPAVNLASNEEEFVIELAAPGLCKDNYTLEVDNDVLHLKAQAKEKPTNKYTQKQFSYGQFEKSFILPKNIKKDEISAACSDGILTVHLPKMDTQNNNLKRTIPVS